MKNQWVCDSCYPSAVEIGEFASGEWLMLDDGKFVILGGNGHRGEVTFTFPFKPEPEPEEPTTSENSEEENAYHALWLDWHYKAEKIGGVGIPVSEAPHFVAKCVKAGYDSGKDGNLGHWLLNRAGQLVAEMEKKHGKGYLDR